jgi:DNA-binding transcriptional MerR regulator
LLTPSRTEKGHRLYSIDDVQRVNVILAYIKRGVAVSKVKALLRLKYNKKQSESDLILSSTNSKWPEHLEGFIECAKSFDLRKLDQLYNKIISLYPIEIISVRLFLPLLKTYQAHILASYEGAVAEEHFLANYIRNRLAAHFQQLASSTRGPKFLFAALPTERHDFILLLFAIHCMNRGFNVISLGTNTPLEQIIFAAKKAGTDSIVCFGRLSAYELKIAKSLDDTIFNYQHRPQDSVTHLPEDFSEALIVLQRSIKKITGE